MAGDEVKQLTVAGGCCWELLISDGFAVFGDNGDVVCVGVGVNTDDDLRSFLGQYGDGPARPGFSVLHVGLAGRQHGNGTKSVQAPDLFN